MQPAELCGNPPQLGIFPHRSSVYLWSILDNGMDQTMDAQTPVPNHVNGFCREHGISRAHFYNLLKRGDGPVIMKVGRRTLISTEAAAEWRRRMTKVVPPKGVQ
jgi:hypothetical protein